MIILYPLAAKFPLGQLVATSGVLVEISASDISAALARHAMGDWGDLDEEDVQCNDRALLEDGRLLASYRSGGMVKFWIITEWDRSATTVLLPSEY